VVLWLEYSLGDYYQSECPLRIDPTKLRKLLGREVLIKGVLPRAVPTKIRGSTHQGQILQEVEGVLPWRIADKILGM